MVISCEIYYETRRRPSILLKYAVYLFLLFQVELSVILYPVFIHMYLELVYNGHEQHGKFIQGIKVIIKMLFTCL